MLLTDAFVEKPPGDCSIWRYLNLEKFLSFLQSNALFFTCLSKLDDPMEGQYPEELWKGIEQKMSEVLAAVKISATPKQLHAHARDQTYVNCWHLNEGDNAAMWSLYSGKAGVAIKSRAFKLYDSLHHCTLRGIHLGQVQYVRFSLAGFEQLGPIAPAFLKRLSFAHEAELRAVIKGTDHDPPEGFLVPIKRDELIEEIFVDPRSERWVVDVIRDMASKYNCNAPIKQSDLYRMP